VLDLTRRLLAAADGTGAPVVSASIIEPGRADLVAGARMLVEGDGTRIGTLGDEALDGLVAGYAVEALPRHVVATVYVADGRVSERTVANAVAVYIEVVEHQPVFLIVGAGHIGRSLAKLAKFLGFHVAVLDDREDFATAELLPDADEVICEDFEVALARFPIGANTTVVMVTRGHRQDELALRCSLGRGAGYVGMIGSKRRTSTVLDHLAQDGFAAAELAAVHTPIGLDIGAETPEEIAVSIVAEVILERRGGSGASMRWRRPSADVSAT
jgi:xanthine dehydrogenase accessory factor